MHSVFKAVLPNLLQVLCEGLFSWPLVPSSVSSCLTFTPRPSPRPAEKEKMSGEDVTRRDEERGDAEEEEAEAIDGEEESDADASDSEEMDVEKPTIVPGSSK